MAMDKHRPLVPSNGSVKIGGLWKRSQGLSRFTRPNFKHRVFILTEQALSYYGGTVDRVGTLKRRVDLSSVRAVEFVDLPAFNLAHTLQVVYTTKKHGFVTLYITATDKAECADWVATLRQACYFNQDMHMHYHPGAMFKDKWSCCQQQGKNSLGCQPTYHLLTRSSSRYAQMRRKDTLTNSQRRRSNVSSNATERRSAVATAQLTASDTSASGMSNSCMDLAEAPPHSAGTFSQTADPSSQRSSRISSTEPSVSMGSITLTRVSVLESSGSFTSSVSDADREAEARKRLCEPRLVHTWDRRASRGRSQVAPEAQKVPLNHFPLEVEKDSSRVRSQSEGEVPRPSATSFSGSVTYMPSVPPISEKGESVGKISHSKTFVVSTTIHVGQDKGLCSSTSALVKPTIEPRVSHSNPNVIHV